jgi:predicted ribosomally synthesized peptide with nif11-like leader
MSMESARAFLKRMKSDSAFAERVTACKDANERVAMVKAAGYEFANDDLPLDDAELNAVSGGTGVRACGGYQYAECCNRV